MPPHALSGAPLAQVIEIPLAFGRISFNCPARRVAMHPRAGVIPGTFLVFALIRSFAVKTSALL